MRHKYSEMIRAKAENTNLVLLVKSEGSGEWFESIFYFPVNEEFEYFLCHPKHTITCLHLLNGGDIYLQGKHHEREITSETLGDWLPNMWYLSEDYETRIQPKKETWWVVVENSRPNSTRVTKYYCSDAYPVKSEAEKFKDTLGKYRTDLQVVPIEVEVG